MTEIISPIPTTIDGITFKSRLEGRFYEWLRERDVEPEYEPTGFECINGYAPDFFIKGLDVFVEVKPREFLDELDIFWSPVMTKDGYSASISFSDKRWMCVDQRNRREWDIIRTNSTFKWDLGEFPEPSKFDVITWGYDLRVFSEYVDIHGK